MRKILISAVLIFIVFMSVGVSAQVALATTRPLRPGHPIFPMQDMAEQARAQIIFDDAEQTTYYLELATQRSDDLFILADSGHAIQALDYLNQALDRVIISVSGLTGEDATRLQVGIQNLILKIDMVLNSLQNIPTGHLEMVEHLQVKVTTLEILLADLDGIDQVAFDADLEQLIQDAENLSDKGDGFGTAEVPPHSVLFPPGSPGAEHEFFTLDGSHEVLDCLECHVDGKYAGTPNLCIDCHLEQEPEAHYGGVCAGCHTAFSWQDVNFDHGLLDTSDCQACHLEEEPEDHYVGQCSACHNSEDWKQADFNHQAVDTKDCQFCHTNDKPSNHYRGQCSACHNTTNWAQANFNHQAVGATDCKDCHSGRKPANHYGGQCSACHNTTNWSQANFNHQAVGATDCKACHSGKKPANHFGGQCSACHSTSSWSGATFNHGAAGATDCKACHSGRKPANHFDGQCSQCHTTSSWGGASFNHSFPMNHGDADGKCSKCHPSGGSNYNCFACHDKDKMINKHNEKGISNIGSRCLDCHPRGKEGGDGD